MGAADDDDDSVSAIDLLAKVQHRMESQRNLMSQRNLVSQRNLNGDGGGSSSGGSKASSPSKASMKSSSPSRASIIKASSSPTRDSVEEKKCDEDGGERDDFPKGEEKETLDEEDEEEEEDDDDDDEEDEDADMDASDLLEAVKGRMEQQKFMDEVKDLRKMLEEKDAEIKQLKGQLQMAISTKHSLLVANSELEQRHQKDMEDSVRFEEDLQRSSRVHMNVRAEIEKDFMNDLMKMARQLQIREEELSKKDDQICKLEAKLTQKKIKEEQCTDCIEKSETIRCLQEKVHRLEKLVPKQETEKVKFYKLRLGLK